MLGSNEAGEEVPASLRTNYEADPNLLIDTLEVLPTSPASVASASRSSAGCG